MRTSCSLVIPCRNEGPALRDVLDRVPEGIAVVVVDNGSTDDTAKIARAFGARVVFEARPGYGAAVHAGVCQVESDLVAVMDGDGTFDPRDTLPLIEAVSSGRCDLALGRRVVDDAAGIPLAARIGNRLVSRWFRQRGLNIHDIAPMRVCETDALLALHIGDRRFGYPFELLRRALEESWRVEEFPVPYGPRAAGTRSKVSGSWRGTALTTLDAFRALT